MAEKQPTRRKVGRPRKNSEEQPEEAIEVGHEKGPNKTPKKKGLTRKEFDSEILQMNNQNMQPLMIASLLCTRYKLDPHVMNRKSVESRLRYLKKNQLGSLAPMNDRSRELFANPITSCM